MTREKIHYILLKTHNKTGLKYLCKHVSSYPNSPYNYKGSGVYWKRHLNKHGADIHTEILSECKTADEAKTVGLYYSEKFNVVDSKEFANLVPENGQGGAEVVKHRKNHPGWRGLKMFGDDNPSKRPEVREKISKALTGRKFSAEWRQKLSDSAKGRIPWSKGKSNPYATTDHMNVKVVCPHCFKEGGKGAMIRWHFDNCKHRIKMAL